MSDVKVTIPRSDYNPNQRTDIDVEVVNPDGTVSTKTVKGAVQAITQEDGSVSFGILASAHVPFGGGGFASAVLAHSPLVYWRLGESSGTTAADESGNGLTGTYVGSPTLGVTGLLAGDADTAIELSGSGQYVKGSAAAAHTGSVTAIALCKTDTVAAGVASLCAQYDEGNAASSWMLYRQGSQFKMLSYRGGISIATASNTVSTGQTYLVVGFASSSAVGLRVYNDSGSLVGSGSATGLSPNTGVIPTFYAGESGSASATDGYLFDGVLDEVALVNSVLSTSAIDDLAAAAF